MNVLFDIKVSELSLYKNYAFRLDFVSYGDNAEAGP